MRLTFSLLLLNFGGLALAGHDWNENEIKWHSYEQGIKEMQRTGKMGMMVIYTDWCGTCKQYSRLFKKDEVVSATKDVVMILVNQENNPKVARKYAPDGRYIPRTFVLKTNGEIAMEMHGKKPKWRFFVSAGYPKQLLDLLSRASGSRS